MRTIRAIYYEDTEEARAKTEALKEAMGRCLPGVRFGPVTGDAELSGRRVRFLRIAAETVGAAEELEPQVKAFLAGWRTREAFDARTAGD